MKKFIKKISGILLILMIGALVFLAYDNRKILYSSLETKDDLIHYFHKSMTEVKRIKISDSTTTSIHNLETGVVYVKEGNTETWYYPYRSVVTKVGGKTTTRNWQTDDEYYIIDFSEGTFEIEKTSQARYVHKNKIIVTVDSFTSVTYNLKNDRIVSFYGVSTDPMNELSMTVTFYY